MDTESFPAAGGHILTTELKSIEGHRFLTGKARFSGPHLPLRRSSRHESRQSPPAGHVGDHLDRPSDQCHLAPFCCVPIQLFVHDEFIYLYMLFI